MSGDPRSLSDAARQPAGARGDGLGQPLGDVTFDDLRAQLAAPAPSLAGASAAALTAAIAAGLVTMIGEGSPDWPQGRHAAGEAARLGDRLVVLAAEDARGFGRVLEVLRAPELTGIARGDTLAQALLDASEPAVAIAEAAAEVAWLAGQAAAHGKSSMRADAAAASTLAQAAVRCAVVVIDANLLSRQRIADSAGTAGLQRRIRTARERAGIADYDERRPS
jgi:formiminotetrahydrofolate cyclodeaminase